LPPAKSKGVTDHLEQNILLRVAVYYVVLFGAVFLWWKYIPASLLPHEPLDSIMGGSIAAVPVAISKHQPSNAPVSVDQLTLTMNVAVAMIAAVLLVLPVAWIYILTRHKKGFQQSVVQSMMILPPIAAGVVVMVKYSLALAFGFTGILAAIRFRNTLDDSKDAVYIFVATALGLAAAVELPVAAVLSIIFNILILALWWSDFGRAPAPLEGGRAQRRIDRAMAQMRKTGSFVAMLDEQVFRDMTPEQLDLAADRAWRRKRRLSTEPPTADEMQRRDVLLRVEIEDTETARPAVEEQFESYLKKWRMGGIVRDGDGKQTLEYAVQLKKSAEPEEMLSILRDLPDVISAELK
jgi:hypothetical protein